MPDLKSFCNKFVVIILALQILNLSIYNADYFIHLNCVNHHTERLNSQNPIDSFAELIAEHIMNVKNAFPETETNQKSSKQRNEDFKHNFNLNLFQVSHFTKVVATSDIHHSPSKKIFSLYRNTYSFLYYKEINNPPV